MIHVVLIHTAVVSVTSQLRCMRLGTAATAPHERLEKVLHVAMRVRVAAIQFMIHILEALEVHREMKMCLHNEKQH